MGTNLKLSGNELANEAVRFGAMVQQLQQHAAAAAAEWPK